jgi:hypothetical protein
MTDKIATLRTKADPWPEALKAMEREHRLLPVDTLISIDKVLEKYPEKKEYNIRTHVQGDQTVRVFQLFDKDNILVNQWDNMELIDDKLYVKIQHTPHVPRVSWFNWMFSRFYAPRGPTVNVNVRR